MDPAGGGQPKSDFDIIQHSQSHFEGVSKILNVKRGSNKSSRGAAALQSFANAGGSAHASLFGQKETESEDKDSSDDNSELGAGWCSKPEFERWIVIEGVKPSQEHKLTQAVYP